MAGGRAGHHLRLTTKKAIRSNRRTARGLGVNLDEKVARAASVPAAHQTTVAIARTARSADHYNRASPLLLLWLGRSNAAVQMQ
jgi:hypothetical protein